jgi:RNA polymerase sigma factor (sigma-70 family)
MRLAHRMREKERKELHDVYRRNVAAVYAFFSYSVCADTAEDLTAATFERVVRYWPRFDPSRSSVRSWILTIARNVQTDHYRRQSHRRGPSLDEYPALAGALAAPDDHARGWLGIQAIEGWLSHLRPREREVLALRYGADLSADEIARCLGISRANVHQLSSRALRRLREIVGEPELTYRAETGHHAEITDSASSDGAPLPAGI